MEWLAGQRLIAGTVDDVVADLKVLYDAGARNIVMPQMLPDVVKTTKNLRPVVEAVHACSADQTAATAADPRRRRSAWSRRRDR